MRRWFSDCAAGYVSATHALSSNNMICAILSSITKGKTKVWTSSHHSTGLRSIPKHFGDFESSPNFSLICFVWLFFFSLQWVPEITHHCPKTPFLLVGTQIDLRDDPSTVEKLAKNKQKPITPETAEKLARDLKAVKYVECSALTQVRRPIT